MPLYYFGKHLVLFRTEDGTPYVFDAHCPHMGAHLGYGGRVEGNTIRCPFHCWGFNPQGTCVDIPYANKISPEAQIRTWPVCELNGLIMVYYHLHKELPTWKMPEIPKWNPQEWTRFEHKRWKVRTHVQEVAENSMDNAHFVFVHKPTYRSVKDHPIEIDGPVLSRRLYSKLAWGGKLGMEEDCWQEFIYYGLGCGVIYSSLKSMLEVNTLVVVLMTPIDEEYVDVHLLFSVKKLFIELATHILQMKGMADCITSMEQEIPIFENKVHLSHPLLCEGEGSIMQYRHWTRQFYSELPKALTVLEEPSSVP